MVYFQEMIFISILECLSSDECDLDKICSNKTCIDPCEDYPNCDEDYVCKVVDSAGSRNPQCVGKL